MKRHMMPDVNSDTSKKLKSDSVSNIIEKQALNDRYINEATEGTKTSLLEQANLATDGEKALCTKRQSRISKKLIRSGEGRKRKLKDGSDFDPETKRYRIDLNEKSIANQCAKITNSGGVNRKPVEESASCSDKCRTGNKLPREQSAENLKKIEQNQDTANNTYNKTVDKFVTNFNTKPEKSDINVICTEQLQDWKLPNAPKQVPLPYASLSPRTLPTEQGLKFCGIPLKRKKPDQETNILIPPEDDDFGATLCTYIEHMDHGRIYNRHFFEKVVPNQPASKMKIKEDDELVLLNNEFVPAFPHTDVLRLFQHINVDGKTRFALVIRRKVTNQKWDWIETSAVLAPEKQDDSPTVTGVIYKKVSDDQTIYRPATKHLYRAPGDDKYIDIRDGKVQMKTMNIGNNKAKIIWKHPKFWQYDSEGHLEFATTLCDRTKTWYIKMNEQEEIVVDREPFWFKMIEMGSKIRFQFQKLYLGYNLENDKLQAQVINCLFEELPAPSIDKPDGVASNKDIADLEDVQNDAEQLSGTQLLHLDGSSQICKDSDKSGDAASLSSADSGASDFNFTGSCSSGTDYSDHLSFSSETSGYRTSTPDCTDINTSDEVGLKFSTH